MYVHLTKTMEGYVRTRADQVFFGLASRWNTHWLPPENVYVACDLSLSDQQKVAKQRRNMVHFTAAAASPPSPSGAGGQGRRSIRLGQATYPLHFWDRHESATLLDFAAQQEGLVELVATLADGCTTGRLVLAWSSYMAPVEGRRNKRQSALKYTLLDARSPYWEAASATLRGTSGGRAVDRLLRYEVLEGPLVRHGEGVSKYDQLRIAGEDVEVTLTITRPEGNPLRWRTWKVEVSCDGGGGGGNQGALDENSRISQDIDAPEKRPLFHAATWKTL
ncbi:hypothetical protein PG999_005932 [Apiospora kogelbergensis]|uniref:Uncharacterized protein n=1 Tax=Apiospora kogelbergensis TaxID=1337665 RepID=A0AAW0QPX1_9PEZI